MEEDIKELVLQFHNTYEELAPKYGYETRKDTREFDFNSKNGQLMYATIEKVVKPILNRLEQDERIIDEMAEEIIKIFYYEGYSPKYIKDSIKETQRCMMDYFIRKCE